MTKREAIELTHQQNRLMALGISREDAEALRRISMTLRRWFELECGTDEGAIERDETTGKPYWYLARSDRHVTKWPIADREAGARKRLATILARYPGLTAYVQGDPRGCSLYILTAEQLKGEHAVDSIYNRGVAVA